MIILLTLLATIGLLNATIVFIQHLLHWNFGRKIYCLTGESCEVVLNSKYSRTFILPNEVWGMGFYTLFLGLHLINQGQNQLYYLALTIPAGLYSVYLLYLQRYKIKQWCSWCLISIITNWLLLASVLYLW